jgi:hypothetical protein
VKREKKERKGTKWRENKGETKTGWADDVCVAHGLRIMGYIIMMLRVLDGWEVGYTTRKAILKR